MGAVSGGMVGALLYSLGFYVFAEDNPTLVLWLTISISAFFVAVLAMIFFDYAVIVGSAFSGSYFFVRVIPYFLKFYRGFQCLREGTRTSSCWCRT